MAYETDAADAQLFEDGDIAGLLAKYNDIIVGRCVARLRGGPDAEDVAQNVRLRLLSEFHRGKRYGGLPYRVVVHMVIGWTIADYFAGRPMDAPLPGDWNPGGSDFAEGVLERHSLMSLFEPLPEREQQVMERHYLLGMDIDQIAADLGIDRNNVDQALFRGRKRLREELAAHG